MAMIVIAAYDISEDDRRSRAAARLQAWGDRVQKSLFMLDLTPGDFDLLVSQLDAVIDHDVDSFYFWRQCGSCWSAVESLGQASPPERHLYWVAL